MKVVAWILGIAAVIALICFLLPIILTVVAWLICAAAVGYGVWQVIYLVWGPFGK